MRFEYKLNYDFVSNELSFEITKMPEELRNTGKIISIMSSNGAKWNIESRVRPEIDAPRQTIFLRGRIDKDDYFIERRPMCADTAITVADVLKKFQEWVESNPTETVMTIAEIEEKLGIKNLKIVKEVE